MVLKQNWLTSIASNQWDINHLVTKDVPISSQVYACVGMCFIKTTAYEEENCLWVNSNHIFPLTNNI